ncbi:MAG: hypothetical protein OXK77_16395 [Gemmatimonadota bacterium]|nr:hypothetical protein [Gemmatimonadota bacterium]MDE2864417.1 hypothetical protein [Gemmatimonadota bacterium]
MTVSRALAALLLSLSAAACHAYRPTSIPDLQGGDRVRALLTQAQHEEFAEYLFGGDRLVQGTVIEADLAGVLLEVPVVTVAEGIRVDSYSQRFRIPAAGVADVELRSLDRGRTLSLAGVVAAALGGMVWYEFARRSRRGTTVPPGPPEEDRIIIQIPFLAR